MHQAIAHRPLTTCCSPVVPQLVKLANDKVTNIRRLVGRCVVRLRERKGFNGQVTFEILLCTLTLSSP